MTPEAKALIQAALEYDSAVNAAQPIRMSEEKAYEYYYRLVPYKARISNAKAALHAAATQYRSGTQSAASTA